MAETSGRRNRTRWRAPAVRAALVIASAAVVNVVTAPVAAAQSGLEQSKQTSTHVSELFGNHVDLDVEVSQYGIDVSGSDRYTSSFADIYTGRAAVVEIQASRIGSNPPKWIASWMAPDDTDLTVDVSNAECKILAEGFSSGTYELSSDMCFGAEVSAAPQARGVSTTGIIYVADELTNVDVAPGRAFATSAEFHAVKGATLHVPAPGLVYGAVTGLTDVASGMPGTPCVARTSALPSGLTVHMDGSMKYTPPDGVPGSELTFNYSMGQIVSFGEGQSACNLISPTAKGTVTIFLADEQPPKVVPITVVAVGQYGDDSMHTVNAFASNPWALDFAVDYSNVKCTEVWDGSGPVSDLSTLEGSRGYPIFPPSCTGATGSTSSDQAIFAYSGIYYVEPATQEVWFEHSLPATADEDDTFKPEPVSTVGLTPVDVTVSGACVIDDDTGEVTITESDGNCVVTATQAGNNNYSPATHSDVVGPIPSLTVQGAVATGAWVPVAGAGWPTNSEVLVFWYTSDGSAIANTNVHTNSEGAISTSLKVPDVSAQELSIDGSAVNGGFASPPSTVEVWESPTLTVPASAKSGESLPVGGAGWPAGSFVQIVWYRPDGSEIGRTGDTAGPEGDFVATLDVPENLPAGMYSVQANTTLLRSAPRPVAVNGPLTQTLSFAEFGEGVVPNFAVGYGNKFKPEASSDSGLIPRISVAGACSRDGVTGVVTMTASSGKCTVTAYEPGNDHFKEARITKDVVATKAAQVLQLIDASIPSAGMTFGESFTPAVFSSAGLISVIEASGSCRSEADTGRVTATSGTGACELSIFQAGSLNYEAATAPSVSITVAPASQMITSSAPSFAAVGTSLGLSARVIASSGLPAAFVVDTEQTIPADACVVSGTAVTFAAEGTCVIHATQPGNNNYTAAAPISVSISVTGSEPTRSSGDMGPTTGTLPTDAPSATTPGSGGTGEPLPPVSFDVEAGDSVTWTVQAPSPGTAIVPSLTSPNAGTVTFALSNGSESRRGFHMVGWSFEITAPPASAAEPLRLGFAIDNDSVPAGLDLTDLTVFRDGQAVQNCANRSAGVADPDPCVASVTEGGGITTVTVLSSHASTWAIGFAENASASTGIAEPEAASGPAVAAPDDTTGAATSSDGLAGTGFSGAAILGVGALLILSGLMAVWAAGVLKRRRLPS